LGLNFNCLCNKKIKHREIRRREHRGTQSLKWLKGISSLYVLDYIYILLLNAIIVLKRMKFKQSRKI